MAGDSGGVAEALRRVDRELRSKFERYGVGSAAGGKALSAMARARGQRRCLIPHRRRRPHAHSLTHSPQTAPASST